MICRSFRNRKFRVILFSKGSYSPGLRGVTTTKYMFGRCWDFLAEVCIEALHAVGKTALWLLQFWSVISNSLISWTTGDLLNYSRLSFTLDICLSNNCLP
jgi:hypothetical protein